MGNFGTTLEQRLTPTISPFEQISEYISKAMRVALPAVVQSFSPGPPATVSVLIAIRQNVLLNVADQGITVGTQAQTLPLLTDVPILIPTAGGWSLTFPIEVGDECMVVFQDRAIDSWLQSGVTVTNTSSGPQVSNYPIEQRWHSLSDAIAVFGLRSAPKAIENYSTDSCQLRNDDSTVVVDLASSGITVTAPAVTVNCSGSVSVTASDSVTISGSSVTIGSDTTIDGRVFLDHVHSDVMVGGSYSGPVV